RVTFLGRRSDVPEMLAAADVFVLGSRWEGNPLSVMEAMAAGLPVVVTAVGGVPELVEHGVDGFLIPPGNSTALSEAMQHLHERPGIRSRMGDSAKFHASQKFDSSLMIKAYEDLYDKLLAKLSGRGAIRESAIATT